MSPLLILFLSALSFVLLFFFFFKKKNVGGLAKLSMMVYAGMAVGCFLFSLGGAYDIEDLKEWPFLVYFVVFVVLVYPLSKVTNFARRIEIRNVKIANMVASGYLICCILQLFISGSKAIDAINSGNYFSIYLHREDYVFYNNIFEQININIVNYFFIPVIVYCFYIFAHKINYKFKWSLMIVPFIAKSAIAISYASRTDFFYIVLIYGSLFFLYKNDIPQKLSKVIIKVGAIFSGVAVLGMFVISQSRFASSDDNSWLALYFGESNITAHDTFAYTTRYSNGTYFFRNIAGAQGIKTISTLCKKDHGTGFRPVISCRFSDFGPEGFVFYVIACLLIMSYFAKKKKITWGGFYILLFYYKSITLGAFYENTDEVAWIYVIIVSCILTFLSKFNVKKASSISELSRTRI